MKLLVVGSSNSSNIVLSSPYVSAYHAEILLLDNGDIILEDKGSRNGTFLKENKLQPNTEVNIKRGDNVRFANVVLDWRQVPTSQIDMKSVKEMRGIGSNFRNRYQIQGTNVSRFHATMKKLSSGKWVIQDHSTNGTTINGVMITKEQEVTIKRGDKILCGGVAVENPCDSERGRLSIGQLSFRKIAMCACLIIALCFSLKFLFRSCNGSSWSFMNKTMTDNQIYDRYKSATVLLFAGYYYNVTAGDLNLKLFDLPSQVMVKDGKIVDVSESNEAAMYFGTGFFVSANGNLITNLHIAKPWLFDNTADVIEKYYKQKLQVAANTLALEYPELPLGAYVSEVKVEGMLKFIGLIPNGEEFDEDNFIKCKVLSAGDDPNIDVALIHSVKGLPQGCSYVNADSINIDDKALSVGNHIYTMGFPAGTGLQDLNSNKGILLYGRGGSIIQESTSYSFGFDAASYGGASGSPIFNDHGELVGVLNAGFSKTQGFNFGIKAKYAKELIDNSGK